MFHNHSMPPLVALGLGATLLAVLLALALPAAVCALLYGVAVRSAQLFNFLRRLARRAVS